MHKHYEYHRRIGNETKVGIVSKILSLSGKKPKSGFDGRSLSADMGKQLKAHYDSNSNVTSKVLAKCFKMIINNFDLRNIDGDGGYEHIFDETIDRLKSVGVGDNTSINCVDNVSDLNTDGGRASITDMEKKMGLVQKCDFIRESFDLDKGLPLMQVLKVAYEEEDAPDGTGLNLMEKADKMIEHINRVEEEEQKKEQAEKKKGKKGSKVDADKTLGSLKVGHENRKNRKNVTRGHKLVLAYQNGNHINMCNMGTNCKSFRLRNLPAFLVNSIGGDLETVHRLLQMYKDKIPGSKSDLESFLDLTMRTCKDNRKNLLQYIFTKEHKAINAIMKELDRIEYDSEKLSGYDVDHIIPREESYYNKNLTVEELDQSSNCQLLCQKCHRFKTSQESILKNFPVKKWKVDFTNYFKTEDGMLFAQMRHCRGTIYGKLPDWDKIKRNLR